MEDSYLLRMRGGKDGGGKGPLIQTEVSGTLATSNEQTLFQPVDFRNGKVADIEDATGTLQSKPNGGYSLNYQSGVTDGYVVRRLTPIECERLQGFPDGHTDIPYKGKEHPPDTARYKALGNSFAVPVVRWIGERIQMVQDILDERGASSVRPDS